MGGKHKKTLRSEKAKVKLKAVKLPKGLNVTKTEFKVRKIVFREQLTTSYNEEDGKRIINIKVKCLLYSSSSHSVNSFACASKRRKLSNEKQIKYRYKLLVNYFRSFLRN